jgi:hypothetical protein
MNVSRRSQIRILLTGVITLTGLGQLAWEYFHGGVRIHHLLHRPDLPAISNWWGVLVLPALAWFLIGRIQQRVDLHPAAGGKLFGLPATIVGGFVGSLLFGVLFTITFTYGFETATSYLFLSMLPIALLFPIYRGEYMLGFVLGMDFAFGVVLSAVAACIIASISAVFRLSVRRVLKFIAARRRP